MSRKISRPLEKHIFIRDQEKCVICGDDTPFDRGEIDHIIPKSRGGTEDPKNLQWTCTRCNRLKGNSRTNDDVRIILGLPIHTFTVKWFLSGDVMPKPRYGSGDIPNSNKDSFILVNQLGRDQKVKIKGDFNSLNPKARYRLSVANQYTIHTAWPGLFSNSLSPVSFYTDSSGKASREFILSIGDFPNSGTHSLSLWLNELDPNRTILISENFTVII